MGADSSETSIITIRGLTAKFLTFKNSPNEASYIVTVDTRRYVHGQFKFPGWVHFFSACHDYIIISGV